MTQDWTYWTAALGGDFGPVSDGVPHAGFWRTRRKGQPWEPVALWKDDDGSWIALRNGRAVDAAEAWNWCCRHPITEGAYHRAMRGEGFVDEPPPARGSVIGDNAPADPVEAMLSELQGEEELATELLASTIQDQAAADRASIWAKRVADIAGRAEKAREVEKRPHLEAGRAVDMKWNAVRDAAKDLAARLKKHIEPFLIKQRRAEEERARKSAEEARLIREQAEAASRAARADDEAERSRIAELDRKAAEADRASTVRNATAGRTGARVALRTETKIVVTDFAAAAGHYVAARHPELVELVDRLAARDVKAGARVPGTERRTREIAA